MSLIVDVSANGNRLPISRARIKDIAVGVLKSERVRHALVSIAFVSKREIARLNRRHLRHTGATDVISFSLSNGPGAGERQPVVGDIYIAPDVARDNAARFGGSVREELARLVIHGTLHAVGHDHPHGADRTKSVMWRRQEKLLATLGRATRRAGAR
jgi:probable rRNA maturation factor